MAEETIKDEVKKAEEFIAEPKHIKSLRIVIILAVCALALYLLIMNFVIGREFISFYDIGGQMDANSSYLSPLSRISDIGLEQNISYRNLTSNLVYFNANIPVSSETVTVEARFKDNNFSESIIKLGAQDSDIWNYNWHSIYNPSLSILSSLSHIGNVYRINSNLPVLNLSDLEKQSNIVIATDQSMEQIPSIVSGYKNKETIINTSLRGGHTFYIYISGNLSLLVEKQDLNWYNGSDELNVSLFDSNNNLISNMTIPDDGIIGVQKGNAQVHSKILKAYSLPEGVYRIEFSDFDGLIRLIKINTNKIVVANRIFLADNSIYGLQPKKSDIYLESDRNFQLRLQTYHWQGLQTISYNDNPFSFSNISNIVYLDLSQGNYSLILPKNDIILSYPGYFAFSKENYFEPFKQRIIPIPGDINYLIHNSDYLVTSYNPPVKDGEWLIANTTFNINEENLFIKNNKLSLVFNAPYLNPENSLNPAIPLDWIKITVYKPGLFANGGKNETSD